MIQSSGWCDTKNGLILLPTKGRKWALERYIETCRDLHVTEPHVIILEEDDHSYDGVSLPWGWIVRVFAGGKGAASHYNKIFAEFPDLNYYGTIADDVVPETFMWDRTLMQACMPDKVAYGDEGIDRTATHGVKHLPVHCFIGGDKVREWGFIVPPVLDHFYCDNWWFDAAEQVVMPQVKLTHHHRKNGKAPNDATYMQRPAPKEEEQKYLDFCTENAHLLHKSQITLRNKIIKV